METLLKWQSSPTVATRLPRPSNRVSTPKLLTCIGIMRCNKAATYKCTTRLAGASGQNLTLDDDRARRMDGAIPFGVNNLRLPNN